MSRDANTPLILWICAAVCAHYMFAEGGGVVAQYHDDRTAIANLGAHVRERVRSTELGFEVSTSDWAQKPDEPSEPLPSPTNPVPKPKPSAAPAPTPQPKPEPAAAREKKLV